MYPNCSFLLAGTALHLHSQAIHHNLPAGSGRAVLTRAAPPAAGERGLASLPVGAARPEGRGSGAGHEGAGHRGPPHRPVCRQPAAILPDEGGRDGTASERQPC